MTKAKQQEAKTTGEPGWRFRRWLIFPVVFYSCYELHLMRGDADTHVNEAIAYIHGMVIMVLVFGYTGFATAQDIIAIWRVKSGRPYAEDPPAPPLMDEGEKETR